MSFPFNPAKIVFGLFKDIFDLILKVKDRREDKKKNFYKTEIEPLFGMCQSAVDDIFRIMHKFENSVEPYLARNSYATDEGKLNVLSNENITKLVEEFSLLREAGLSNRVDLLRRIRVVMSSVVENSPEDVAIQSMMGTINYLIEGKEGDGTGSRPRSLLDVLRLIEEHQDEMPDWVKVKLGSPYLKAQLKDCEVAWGEVCTLNEQLRYFYYNGKRPEGGYRKPQFSKHF